MQGLISKVALSSTLLLLLAACGDERKEISEPAFKASRAKLEVQGSDLLAPADWLVLHAGQEMPLLLSGTDGQERLVLPNSEDGYTIALVKVDCPMGIAVREVRSTPRDKILPMKIEPDEQAPAMGAETHIGQICQDASGYRRVKGSLRIAIDKLRAEAESEIASTETATPKK